MMKRPLAVYLLVGFWGLFLTIDLLFIFQGRTAVLGNNLIYSPWLYLPAWKDKLILISIGIIIALLMLGVWLGKSWARNLTMALCALVVSINGISIIRVFNIFSSDEFRMYGRAVTIYFGLALIIFFLIGFYLTLRPEVGRFCGAYPQKTDQS